MRDKYFLDTNIIIYSFDRSVEDKRKKAHELINTALSDNLGIISYQVIQEFINVATKKFLTPLSLNDCRLYLNRVLSPLCEIFPSINLYMAGIELMENTGFSFYDSIIIASALQGGCKTLYSEDMQHERVVLGLMIINPFLN
ncbi:MAG: PIN domain-containing protein [Candidatus Marinimicrobia bacterium]|nr:PIN domain-containing protein [Candidatus Neomarinimicrobiota bacterium]